MDAGVILPLFWYQDISFVLQLQMVWMEKQQFRESQEFPTLPDRPCTHESALNREIVLIFQY